MKAIKITFEDGSERFSTVKNEDEKFGFCYLSDRAERFIKAQSIDNKVYSGLEPCDRLFCNSNGNLSRYYIKSEVYDITDPFAPAKEGEWQWKEVAIRVIDIMED